MRRKQTVTCFLNQVLDEGIWNKRTHGTGGSTVSGLSSKSSVS